MLRCGVALLLLLAAGVAVTAMDNGRALVPPRGVSTWCTGPKYQAGNCGRDVCNEQEIRRMVLALESSGLYDLGYATIVVDNCWGADFRLPNGSLTWDPQRFPSGMPSLISWVKAHGMEINLYMSLGNTTCDTGGRPLPIPGSEGRYQQDIDTLASWNCTAIKGDWCGDVHDDEPFDGIFIAGKDYIKFANAAMNATPKSSVEIYLQGVFAFFGLGAEVVNYVNDWRMAPDHHDNWHNMFEDIIFPMTGLEPAGRPGAWADLDVLMTGGQGCSKGGVNSSHCPGMTDTEYITEFTIWSMIQSPLFVATDISDITPIMKKILFNKLILNMHSDIRTAPGKYVGGDRKNCPFLGRDLCSYWVRQLADGSVYLVLLNANLGNPQKIEFNFNENTKNLPAGWGANTTVSVVDVWADHGKQIEYNPAEIKSKQNNLADRVTGSFEAQVESHGVVAVILTPSR